MMGNNGGQNAKATFVAIISIQGYALRNNLKIRTLEMPFPAIWALNYELQYDFKKGKTLEIVPYF